MSTARDVVVVGVDGSPGSFAALDFALHEAARRGARLRVVVAVEPPDPGADGFGSVLLPPPPDRLARALRAGRRWARGGLARLRDRDGAGVDVEVRAVEGAPAHALLGAARDADLLVVGHRGRGVVASMLLGSVGLRCLLEAPCPVTVVRPVPVPEPVAAPMTPTAVPVPAGG